MNTEALDLIVAEVNEYAERASEYATGTGSCHAEYCSNFGDGECEPDLELLQYEELKPALQRLSLKDRQSILMEHSTIELVGVHNQTNEVFRVNLGEVEEQIDDELSKRLRELSAEEWEYVRRQIDVYMPERGSRDLMYLNHSYDSFVLVADADALLAELRERGLLKSEETEEQTGSFTLSYVQGGRV